MEEYTTPRVMRWLPQVVLATFVVAVLPVVLAWWLRADGVISSPWICVAVAISLSIALSIAGSAYWKRRRSSADVLFSELLIWGWLRRYRIERHLAGATQLIVAPPVVNDEGPAGATVEHAEHRLRQLGSALEAQDPYLEGHSRRVARHSAGVARKLGLTQAEVARVRAAAAVHDIGKLRIPSELLRKPGALTDAEFEAVMRHAEEGAAMVACLGDRELTAIVRHHHERFDGTGYPARLLGDQIPLGARIVAVADTFDAITSVRPYRDAARHKKAIDILVAQAGTQLDPAVVRAFLRYYSGRRASLLWIILAASPQRALAWVGGRTGAPTPVPVGELAVSAVGRMAICAAAVGTTFVLGAARYDGRLVQPAPTLRIAAAPFSLHLKAQPAAAKSRAAAHGGRAVRPAAQLTAAVRFAGSGGAAGVAGGAKSGGGHRVRGAGSSSPGSGGLILSSSGSNGNSSGGGRRGSGGGSGMRTGAAPNDKPRRPPVGGAPPVGSAPPSGPTTAPTAPVAGSSPAGGGAPGSGTPTILNGASAPNPTAVTPSSSPGGTPSDGAGGTPAGGPPGGGGTPSGGGTPGGGGGQDDGGNSGGGDHGHGNGDGHGYG